MYSFISFGSRCNSAIILRYILKLQIESLPFDWVQMNINTMENIMKLLNKSDKIEAFYSYYFTDSFNKIEKKSIDDSWFPHDNFDNIHDVVAQYTRRTYRLFDIIKNNNKKIFLNLQQYVNNSILEKIINILDNLHTDYLLIIINAFDYDFMNEKYINFYVPFVIENGNDSDYDNWNLKIIDKLKNLKYFNNQYNYNILYSLGIRCHTEIILKKLNLIKFSSIFGSLFIKNFDNIIKLFNSDFKLLIDRNNLVYTKNMDSHIELNKLYGFRTFNKFFDDIDNIYTTTFAHHDLSLDKDYQHFERGIQRLNYILKNNIPILFVNLSHINEFNNLENTELIIDCLKEKKYDNFHILFINISNEEKDNIELILKDKYKTIYNIYNVKYESNEKLDNIIKLIILNNFNIDNLIDKDTIDNLINQSKN